MRSADLLPFITDEADEAQRCSIRAEQLRDQLIAEHSHRLQKLLTGVALTAECPEWSLSVSTAAFHASWRKSKIHAALTIYLTLEKVPSWSAMIPVFDALAARGFDADGWTSHDDAASYSRVYNYTVKKDLDGEDPGRVEVQITASLPGDTDTCKRIITGYTNPVMDAPAPAPTPIYKLVCEGEDNAAENQ